MLKELPRICCLLSLLPLLLGCERVLPLDMPDPAPRLVLNSMFQPDSLWQVELTASQGITSSQEYEGVQYATVQVLQGDRLVETLTHTGNGIYRSRQAYPAAYTHYRIIASAPGYPTAEGAGHAPDKPKTDGVQARMIASPDNPGGAAVSLSLQLEDRPGQANYYYIRGYSRAIDASGRPYLEPVSLTSRSSLFEFSLGSRWFFSDKLFDGITRQLDLYYNTYPGQEVQVEIAQLSADYYQYAQTLYKQSYKDNILTQPVGVHGNIKNGFGIFAGYHVQTYRFKTRE
ncbi:DUF4249 domain-containing protein [Pontibacter lucknowensis]|uniref:DUF4249 domain-containing protein n=1 Tax=Pontibacter lucknowensis TaxID=1077936 RepID=A0A1N6Y1M2_9BACT|nr:DUF4249 domain-containing protein [Pontibacter lucknowensis]SIR08468.1 protein of unknown function [Pontibacter lucknowensis]